jgi:membrane protease YdiL (CAAX protease family)
MTTSQMILMAIFYLALMVAVAWFTRATMLRIMGALAGGAAFGVVGLLGIALGENQGWWHVPSGNAYHFRLLLWLGLAISSAPDYLMTWRIDRRFGMRGMAICVLVVALTGPPRDY